MLEHAYASCYNQENDRNTTWMATNERTDERMEI